MRWAPLVIMLLLTLWFTLHQTTSEPADAISSGSTPGEPVEKGRRAAEVTESREAGDRGDTRNNPARVNPQKVGANEAGAIMVLEYHRVGGDPDFAPDWTLSPAQFREQLEYLYEHDYYPINLRDLVENRIDVPAGKTPVVLTFDDSSDTQFTLVKRNGRWVPDPEGAVGVIADFHKEHEDWPMRATFFVLPKADPPNDLFGQPELAGEKLRYLVKNGMEVGTHTLYHANLATASRTEVQEQLTRSVLEIRKYLPDYEVKTLGVPFGEYPADISLLRSGSWNGRSYELEGAVRVAGGASPPPGHSEFDPYLIPRIQAEPHKGALDATLEYFEENPDERYVSDGAPGKVSFPENAGRQLDLVSLRKAGLEINGY